MVIFLKVRNMKETLEGLGVWRTAVAVTIFFLVAETHWLQKPDSETRYPDLNHRFPLLAR